MKRTLTLALTVLLLGLPSTTQAHRLYQEVPPTPLVLEEALAPTTPGVQFKLAREGNRYAVYMRPTVTPEQPALTMTAQVTVRVPHGTGADRFEVADLQSSVGTVFWNVTSRIDAPAEAPEADFISFEFDYESSDFAAYPWQTGQAIQVFSFANSGSYQGSLGLMENCDAFMNNSRNTNPGNQIAILGLNNDNAYLGTYESEVEAVCNANSIFMPVTLRQ
jgi:hypothetical protein